MPRISCTRASHLSFVVRSLPSHSLSGHRRGIGSVRPSSTKPYLAFERTTSCHLDQGFAMTIQDMERTCMPYSARFWDHSRLLQMRHVTSMKAQWPATPKFHGRPEGWRGRCLGMAKDPSSPDLDSPTNECKLPKQVTQRWCTGKANATYAH
ncbi:hypothetical protein LZ32DRAFT_4435 [Colletotrichum eremochloae]|nr:hypothetical protein LZ32DRAFT_4435 [Colletotrichum eremochloae]